MIAMPHPFTPTAAEDTSTESFWLKEAKATLRTRDPVDAAHDAEAPSDWQSISCSVGLAVSRASWPCQPVGPNWPEKTRSRARWADLQCGDILQTSTATIQGGPKWIKHFPLQINRASTAIAAQTKPLFFFRTPKLNNYRLSSVGSRFECNSRY